MKPIRIGVGGPVGAGKTALVEKLTRYLAADFSLGVITNDIFTKEDAQFLCHNGILPPDRIIGVETGGCPHTAIREDASMNLEAMEALLERHPDLEIIFVESGGDNLAATFSPELVDVAIYIIDVAQGEKIPRKGGPGITRSDLLPLRVSSPLYPVSEQTISFFIMNPAAGLLQGDQQQDSCTCKRKCASCHNGAGRYEGFPFPHAQLFQTVYNTMCRGWCAAGVYAGSCNSLCGKLSVK